MIEPRTKFTLRLVRIAAPLFFLVVIVLVGFVAAPEASSSPDQVLTLGVPGVRGGVVTTSEPVAAPLGADIQSSGGNSIDCAAAVQFALNQRVWRRASQCRT